MECNLFCFKKNIQGVKSLNSNDIIDEVDFFTIIIESSFELEDHCLLITDIPLKLKFISENKGKLLYTLDESSVREYFYSQDFSKVFDIYKSELNIKEFGIDVVFYKLFINYPIGLCEIILMNEDGHEHLKSTTLNVTSIKIESEDFKSLVSYVEDKGNSIWAKYSLIKQQANSFDEADRLDWLLIFCKSVIDELEGKYLIYFSFDKIKILKNFSEVEPFNTETTVSEDSIVWLLSNLDVLSPTVSYDVNKIIVNNRPFFPIDILASRLEESTDNPENQLIHGFIEELIFFISEISNKYKVELTSIKTEKFDDVIMYYAYSRKLKLINSLINSLLKIRHYLCGEIPVSKSSIDYLNVNKVESKEHYFFVYNQTLLWLLYKGANYSVNNKYFKGISRLDELFERACYYLIVDTFIQLGYEPIFNQANNDEDILKIVTFVKNKQKVKLYYQNLPDDLVTIKRSSGSLKPDFVIEFDDFSYVILDAKYKKLINIEKFDYPELTLKYLHGIGKRNGGTFNTLGLLVLFPENANTRSFYQKNEFSFNGSSPVFPVIGSIGVNFDNANISLKSTIQEILYLKYSPQK